MGARPKGGAPKGAARGLTPMMRQYFEIKERHPDAILLFRMGDFYEIFFDDAHAAAPVLDLAMTSRDKDSESPIPFCGFPHHSLDSYVPRLLEAGHRVAVCDQVEDPRDAKGIVRREVVRIVTPGMVVGGEYLDERRNNYLGSVFPVEHGLPVEHGPADGEGGEATAASGRADYGLAFVDVSTGDFQRTVVRTAAGVVAELERFEAREVVHPEGWEPPPEVDRGRFFLTPRPPGEFVPAAPGGGTGGSERDAGADAPDRAAVAGALAYLEWTQKAVPAHLREPVAYAPDERLVLDAVAERNLEVVRSLADGSRSGTLLEALDRTRTAMGARLLRRWLLEPLLDPGAIRARHDGVEALVANAPLRAELRENLRGLADLERLNGKVTTGRAGPRDLVGLAASLARVPTLRGLLEKGGRAPLEAELGGGPPGGATAALAARLDPVEETRARVVSTLVDEPPVNVVDGGVIREGVSAELDEARALAQGGRSWIATLEASERERTGIAKIKVGYNRVFGYYLEVPRSKSEQVPADWIRKQTLVNAERYVTPDLKEKEVAILGADERAKKLEADLYAELRTAVAAEAARIGATASALAELDVLVGLAEVAVSARYVRPEIREDGLLRVVDGRHPVVERMLKRDRFTPNDVTLDDGANQLLLVTGPNMAGKSTYMRQVALTVLMAQAGSFVPAAEVQVGLVDRIFTRVGASDRLSEGQSTFMVEMVETARILAEATSRSLVILDEIGRGTSTFDGLSIAWAVAERLADGPARPRTLFATHYHELTELARTRDCVQNLNVSVKEWGDEILFLHRIVPGAASRSYGIQVGRLAGLPEPVVARAREILAELEEADLRGAATPIGPGEPRPAGGSDGPDGPGRTGRRGGGARRSDPQLDLFRAPADTLRAELGDVRIDELTPLEALNLLAGFVHRARGEEA